MNSAQMRHASKLGLILRTGLIEYPRHLLECAGIRVQLALFGIREDELDIFSVL